MSIGGVAARTSPTNRPTKACAGCGRTITWRKRWERDWDAVRWCSDACRRHGLTTTDRALEQSLRELLERRAAAATVCPSEAARAVAAAEGRAHAWRELMEPARAAARRLVVAGEVDITQGGSVVDPSTARGPIRVRRRRARRRNGDTLGHVKDADGSL